MSQTDSTEGPRAEREPPPLSVLCMSSGCTVTRVLVVCHRLTQLKVLELCEREPPPLSVLCMSSCCTVTRVLVVCHRLTQLKVLELRENHLRSLFCVCLLVVL